MNRISADPVIKFFVSFMGLVLIFIMLKELQHIFIPLVMAYFLYFVFEPLNRYLEKKKVPTSLATLIDLIIVIGVFWGISGLIVNSFEQFGSELPVYEEKLNKLISAAAHSIGLEDTLLTNFNLTEILKTLDYGGMASGFFSSTLSFVSTLVFVIFFYMFIGSGHQRILQAVKKRFGKTKDPDEQNGKKVDETYNEILEQIQKYLSTKFYISLLTGAFTGIALWIFGVDFLIVFAILTFLLNFIPNIGSTASVIMPTAMALVQFESFPYAFFIGALLITVQSIFGNIVEPKVMGSRLGLNPIAVLLALLLWGYIWGLVGMFLSVPLTSTLKIIISNSESKNLRFISDLISS